MPNSSPLTIRSRIRKALQKAIEAIFLGLLMLCMLLIVLSVLSAIYSALWIGQPSEVTCQKVKITRVDCKLKYQALLRSSEQQIKNIQGIVIDERVSSSDGETYTKYVASLHSPSGNYPLKTYSIRNDPELEILNHRFNKFIGNSEGEFFISLQYNRWQPIIGFAGLVIMIPLGYIVLVLIIVLLAFSISILVSVINFITKSIKWLVNQLHSTFRNFRKNQHQKFFTNNYQQGRLVMTTQLQRHLSRSPHTYFLLFGLAIGYISFVWWLGMRLIVFLSGAVIVALAIVFWYRQPRSQQTKPSISSANLLQTDVFLDHLSSLDHHIPDASRSLWQAVQQQAQAIQQIATQIAQREATFVPDLLETLHTVLDLVDQLVQALQVIQQVQTPRYQELAQQQLQSSQTRLQLTHDQLQELHDQMALEHLKQRSLTTVSIISTRLQTLITENERGILGD